MTDHGSEHRPERASRSPRPESRDLQELRQLKNQHPELVSAIDMQIELIDAQKRVQARIPLPWIQPDPTWVASQQAEGRPIVRFGDIPLEWTNFRLSMRQTADILFHYDAIDREEHDRILTLARQGDQLGPLVTDWYEATSGVNGRRQPAQTLDMPSLPQVFALAMRPFLARSAESLMPRVELSRWQFGHCPFCGAEPDFATVTSSGERRLICGRCTAHWTFGAYTCPFCRNDARERITSFASRDGRYRVYACDACQRYLKAYDARNAPRPVMLSVDSIATLPLDAAAMQRGYVS